MRYWRLILGFAFVLIGLWVIVGEQLSGASGDAVVNAEVATLRTPISGTLEVLPRPLGAALSTGEELAAVNNSRAVETRSDDLALELRLAEAEAARLKTLIESLAAQQEVLRERLDGVPERLTEAGLTDRRAAEAHALMPRFDDLELRTSEARASLDASLARADALESRLEDAQVAAGRLRGVVLTSPVRGILWERLAVDGEFVTEGQEIVRIVDCSSAVVTLSATESVYNRLEIGDGAQFRLGGESELLDARVTRLVGAGARSIYGSLAVAPSAPELRRFSVTLSVPALQDDPDFACLIGRTGRAFFETRPLDSLRQLLQ